MRLRHRRAGRGDRRHLDDRGNRRRRPRARRHQHRRHHRGSCHHHRRRRDHRDRRDDRHRRRRDHDYRDWDAARRDDRWERVAARRDAEAYCPATCRVAAHRGARHPDGEPADAGSAGRPAAARRTGCCRRAAPARRAWAHRSSGRAADRALRPVRQPVRPGRAAGGGAAAAAAAGGGAGAAGSGGGAGLGAAGFAGAFAAALAGEPLPSALTLSAAGLAPPNDSRNRRATGASTVEDADLTNSP